MNSTERQLADLVHDMLMHLQNCELISGICGCGSSMNNHEDSMNAGHAPLDMGAPLGHEWYTEAVSVLDSMGYYDDADAVAMELPPGTPASLIDEWAALKAEVSALSDKEMTLRKAIANSFFPDKDEGAANMSLGDGRTLTATMKLNRTVSAEELYALDSDLREHGIPVDELIKWIPSLVVSAYRKLTPEKVAEFDAVLTIKPGAPTLEVKIPKKKGRR